MVPQQVGQMRCGPGLASLDHQQQRQRRVAFQSAQQAVEDLCVQGGLLDSVFATISSGYRGASIGVAASQQPLQVGPATAVEGGA